jgi:hypothetical protein
MTLASLLDILHDLHFQLEDSMETPDLDTSQFRRELGGGAAECVLVVSDIEGSSWQCFGFHRNGSMWSRSPEPLEAGYRAFVARRAAPFPRTATYRHRRYDTANA